MTPERTRTGASARLTRATRRCPHAPARGGYRHEPHRMPGWPEPPAPNRSRGVRLRDLGGPGDGDGGGERDRGWTFLLMPRECAIHRVSRPGRNAQAVVHANVGEPHE